MKDARAFGPPPEHTSVKAASAHTSMKAAATSHTSVNGAPPRVLSPPNPATDDTAAAMHQNLHLIMTAYFQGKATKPSKDDDSLDPETAPSSISKFTERCAAPFFAWAGIRPGYLFKSLPPLFPDLAEASSPEKHGIITAWFRRLEHKIPRTFAGFLPSEDLIHDLSKFRLAPPQSSGTKWHRGAGPMAFAARGINDLDLQTSNRDLRLTYIDNLSLSMADTRKLESAPPPVPTEFEAFLLLLSRFTDFLHEALGPDCDLYLKSNKVVLALTLLRQRIARSPEFMSQRAPSIIWALTVATQEFYSEAATASQFNEAESRDKDPPKIIANLDVADLSKLQITAACDLPAFLRHTPTPPTMLPPPAGPRPFRTAPTSTPRTTSQGGAHSGRAATTANPPSRASTSPAAIVNSDHAAEFQSFFYIVPADKRATLGLRKILDGCPDVTFGVLTAKLGGTNSSCLHYHIFGQYGLRACLKEHRPIRLSPGGATGICNLLQPGLSAVLSSA
jgi:hypothetical protein